MSINDEWWNSLSPVEQEQLMMGGITGPTMQDYGFEEDPFTFGGAFNMGYSGPGIAGLNVQPDVSYFTTKGGIKPNDLAEEAKRVNLAQDKAAMSVDNILSGYTGAGGYDIGAFTPTYEFGEPINLPGRRKAEALSRSGGWQGFVTDLIFEQQMSPAEAEAELYRTIQEGVDNPDLNDEDRAKVQSIVDSMGPLEQKSDVPNLRPGGLQSEVKEIGGRFYDPAVIREFTERRWNDLMEDPEFAYQDPETGLYYGKTPEEALVKTDQMKKFDAFGIPYPTASYEDPKYLERFAEMESGLPREAREAATQQFAGEQDIMRGQFEDFARGERTARTAASDLERAFAQYEAGAGKPAQGVWSPTNPYNLPAASLEAAQRAADLDYDVLLRQAEGDMEGEPQLQTYIDQARMRIPATPRGPMPQLQTYMDQAMARANLPEVRGMLPSGMARDRRASVEAARAAAQIDYENALEKWNAGRDRNASIEAAEKAGQIDYDKAYGDWLTGQKQGFLDQAMLRSAEALGINATGGAPFITTDTAGNTTPFTFDRALAEEQDRTASSRDKVTTTNKPRRGTRDDVAAQRRRANEMAGPRSQLANALFQRTYQNPRLAEVAAMGRAMALAQAGQTPFRDAMAARNANIQTMLHGR